MKIPSTIGIYLCIWSGKSRLVKVLRSSLLNGHRTIVDSNSRHLQTSQMLTLPLNFELSSAFENVETPFSSPSGPNLRSMVLANASPTNDKETNSLIMVRILVKISNFCKNFL